MSAPASLDISAQSGAAVAQALLYNVYETLVRIDDSGTFQPLLAKSYTPSRDGLTWTFTLNDGTRFANGDPLTSASVKATFDYNIANERAPAVIRTTFAAVASVAAPDPATVVIKLKRPSRDFLFDLAQTGGVVVDDASRATMATTSNGSGPFGLASYTTNAALVLAANPNYWGTKPALQRATFRYFADANAMATALRSGTIDIIDNLAPDLFADFATDSAHYETVHGVTSGEVLVAMNNGRKPLDDVRVRQAISYAIDRQAVDDAAEQGTAMVIGSHASPVDPWFKDLSQTYRHDPDKAKALLQQAGVSDLRLTLDVVPLDYAQKAAPVIRDELAAIGITVKLNDIDFAQWVDKDYTKSDFDLTIAAHVDARDTNLYGNPDYYWHYNDAKVQKLLAQADAELDEAKSNALYGQVLDQINADAVNEWLFLLPRLEVVRQGISGYPRGSYSLSYDVTGIQ
jgi:peptide/nickel transport system substrate-binding protein